MLNIAQLDGGPSNLKLTLLEAHAADCDLSLVLCNFMHWLLVDPDEGVIKFAPDKKIIQDVADLYTAKIRGEEVTNYQWLVAGDEATHQSKRWSRVAAKQACKTAAAAADIYQEGFTIYNCGGSFSDRYCNVADTACSEHSDAYGFSKDSLTKDVDDWSNARKNQAEKLNQLLNEVTEWPIY